MKIHTVVFLVIVIEDVDLFLRLCFTPDANKLDPGRYYYYYYYNNAYCIGGIVS